MIDKIKNLTRSTKKVKEWENKPLVDIESHSIDSEKGWTRKVFSGAKEKLSTIRAPPVLMQQNVSIKSFV